MPALRVLKTLAAIASLVVLSLGLGVAAPAWAQLRSEPPLTDADGGLLLTTKGYDVWLPAPNWLDVTAQQSGNMRSLVDATFRAGDTSALLQIYPKGESEALWSTLYGVRISTGASFNLKEYRAAIMRGFARNCAPALTGFFQLGQDDGDILAPLGYVCGAYDPRLRTYQGLGEVMVMSFRKQGDAVALVFQQWRGKAFNPSDAASWPVQSSVVEARARQLQAEPRLAPAD
jgi:hypothetical protein